MSLTPKELLTTLMQTEGALCAALVDYNSGMLLESVGSGVDLDMAAAGNTEVVRAKIKTMQMLGLNDGIEDILISLGKQYHIVRLVAAKPGLFIYFVLDRGKANLAMARIGLADVEKELTV